jgi:hypothetical protein
MRTGDAFLTVPREFDIKPRVTFVEKILLLQHSALGVPTNWHICLVSSGSSFDNYLLDRNKVLQR